jgi:hypothetical protein
MGEVAQLLFVLSLNGAQLVLMLDCKLNQHRGPGIMSNTVLNRPNKEESSRNIWSRSERARDADLVPHDLDSLALEPSRMGVPMSTSFPEPPPSIEHSLYIRRSPHISVTD